VEGLAPTLTESICFDERPLRTARRNSRSLAFDRVQRRERDPEHTEANRRVIRVTAVTACSGASYPGFYRGLMGAAEGGEMSLVTYPGCGNDAWERAATTRSKQARKIHPLTWIVAAALLPVLVWDVRQTLTEMKLHHASSEAFRSLHTGTHR